MLVFMYIGLILGTVGLVLNLFLLISYLKEYKMAGNTIGNNNKQPMSKSTAKRVAVQKKTSNYNTEKKKK